MSALTYKDKEYFARAALLDGLPAWLTGPVMSVIKTHGPALFDTVYKKAKEFFGQHTSAQEDVEFHFDSIDLLFVQTTINPRRYWGRRPQE